MRGYCKPLQTPLRASLPGFAGPGGAVAQMGERCNRTAEVRGSIPLGSTTGFLDIATIGAGYNAAFKVARVPR